MSTFVVLQLNLPTLVCMARVSYYIPVFPTQNMHLTLRVALTHLLDTAAARDVRP